MQHPDEGTIHAWLDGALGAEDAAAIAAHVDTCPACAERVREARGLIAGASRIVTATDWGVGAGLPDGTRRRFAAPPTAPRAWRWFTPVRTAAAAVLVLAAGSIVVTREAGRGGQTAPRTATQLVSRHVGESAAAATIAADRPDTTPAASRGFATPAPVRSAAPVAGLTRAVATGRAEAKQRVARVPDESRPPMAAPSAAPSVAPPIAMPVASALKVRPESLRLEAAGKAARAERGRTQMLASEDVARTAAPTASANAYRSLAAPVPARCFEATGDSVPSFLPRRFALESRGFVLDADGVLIPGATWHAARGSSVDVVFVPADSGQVLHVMETNGIPAATVGQGSAARWVALKRCE